ncbi:MAG: FecR domain-containing protein, partial [Lachnospiraceae bacterium]|nr:FecR domain-containing protein [Lachnospiraceae bacterium]
METANAEKKGINKNLIIIIAAVVVAIIALVVGGIFIFGEKTYRVLKIYQVEGQASVVHSDGSEVTPYENMLLQSGDQISLVEGTLIIKADEDKYIYLENNTTIILEADGTAANSRTTIQLVEGAVINQIDEPLSDKSVYELNTQNATMSVRGTVFRAEVFTVAPDEDDAAVSVDNAVSEADGLSGCAGADTEQAVVYTTAQTIEGLVETDLILADGSSGN